MTGPLLISTVAAVGVLHTLVPDHWAPIVVLGRQQGWSVSRTARAAAIAGFGHVTTTLLLGIVLWAVGAFFAASTYGVPLLATMAAVFALATITTYVSVSVAGIAGLQRISLGPLERYGEVASGVFVGIVGVYALITA